VLSSWHYLSLETLDRKSDLSLEKFHISLERSMNGPAEIPPDQGSEHVHPAAAGAPTDANGSEAASSGFAREIRFIPIYSAQ